MFYIEYVVGMVGSFVLISHINRRITKYYSGSEYKIISAGGVIWLSIIWPIGLTGYLYVQSAAMLRRGDGKIAGWLKHFCEGE